MLLGLYRLSALLPLRVCRWFGAAYGWLFLVLNRKRRRVAYTNLGMCFPELSVPERKRLLRRHFVVTGQSYVDLGWLAWATKERLERKIQLVGLEHLRAEVRRGRSVILVVPHCVGISYGAILGKSYALFSMFKPLRNPVVNWFSNKGRMRFGLRLLARQQGLRPVVRALQQEMVFYYTPDEDLGPERSVFVPFFGIQTATVPVLGRLAELTEAAVIPCFVRLLPGGDGYELILKPPLDRFPTGDRLKDAARMNEVMEADIREMPEQYMWTLKLFKTRPNNGHPPYS
jgi:Kdo2-lipid IVA lauroyltransferase/acyltransferase